MSMEKSAPSGGRFQLSFGWCLAIATVVTLPALFAGLFVDDYLHLLTIDGKLHIASPYDVFRFAGGDPKEVLPFINGGPLPWFTWANIQLHFFRPLSSLTMVIDRALFGDGYLVYHLHSTLWYVGLVAVVGVLYRRLLGPAALVAMALYALDEAHLIPAAWWSNRNALLAALPAVAGLIAHIRWREDGWRWGLPLSLLGYTVGFAGAESALGIMPYLGAYELLGRRDAWQRRIGALLPAALMSVVYLVWYKASGYGVHGSGIYLDPVGEFGEFAKQAPARLLMLMANQFVTLPIEAPVVVSGIHTLLAVVCAATLALCAVPIRWAWKRSTPETQRAMVWLLAGAALSCAPSLATFPSGRLMTIPSIGTTAVLAVVLHEAWKARSQKLVRVFAYVLIAMHVVLPLAVWVAGPLLFGTLDARAREVIAASPLEEGDISEVTQIAINPPDPVLAMYTDIIRRYLDRPRPKSWMFLTMSPCGYRMTRTDDRTLEIAWIDGEMMTTLPEQLVRSPLHPFVPGDVIALDAFDARILDVGKHGPTHVRYTFKEALESPKLAFYIWGSETFENYTLPKVGETVELKQGYGLTNLDFIMGNPPE